MIYIGEDHTPSALHLRQVLSEDAAFGQKVCVALMAKEGGHGWMKGVVAAPSDWPAKFDISVNFVTQYLSRLANHLDPASKFPALFTACNPLDFRTKWSGGELLLTEPAFIIDYVERNVVLLAGASTWHGVLPLIPTNGSAQPVRASLAHFNNA
jgi:hypothetical protein